MGFFRENGLKFILIFAVVIVITIMFTFLFSGGGSTKIETYNDMEVSLKNAAIKYTNSNSSLLPKDETTLKKINLDTLVNDKKIDQLYAIDDENVACTGYVTIVMKNDSYIYTPYIRCGKYYETKSLGNYIIDKEEIKSSNDGLYKYEDTYVFRGEDPNNYVMLGDKLFRILEITNNNELKLISYNKTEMQFIWDDRYNSEKKDNRGINNFSKSRLKESLETLYNSEYFKDSDRDKIIKHDLCVGKRALSDVSIDGKAECSIIEKDQYVGLLQVNEYARASIDEKCNSANKPECQNYNFLYSLGSSIRTLNAVSDNTYQIYYIGGGELSVTNASNSFYAFPVIYIDKDVLYQGGDGTLDKPYILK